MNIIPFTTHPHEICDLDNDSYTSGQKPNGNPLWKIVLFYLVIIGLIIGLALMGASCKRNLPGHECKWPNCPYKGIEEADYDAAVHRITGCDNGSDCYCIDVLHLEYPDAEYDELDYMLMNQPIIKQ